MNYHRKRQTGCVLLLTLAGCGGSENGKSENEYHDFTAATGNPEKMLLTVSPNGGFEQAMTVVLSAQSDDGIDVESLKSSTTFSLVSGDKTVPLASTIPTSQDKAGSISVTLSLTADANFENGRQYTLTAGGVEHAGVTVTLYRHPLQLPALTPNQDRIYAPWDRDPDRSQQGLIIDNGNGVYYFYSADTINRMSGWQFDWTEKPDQIYSGAVYLDRLDLDGDGLSEWIVTRTTGAGITAKGSIVIEFDNGFTSFIHLPTGNVIETNIYTLMPIPDINGDRKSDLRISMVEYYYIGSEPDKIVTFKTVTYILYGGQDWLKPSGRLDLTTLVDEQQGLKVEDPDLRDWYKELALGILNFNGDDFDDYIFRSDDHTVTLYLGNEESARTPAAVKSVFFKSMHSHNFTNLTGDFMVFSLGDLNGDGMEEFVVAGDKEQAIIVNGQEQPAGMRIYDDNGNFVNDPRLFKLTTGNDHILTVRPAGDINNDGYDDVIINTSRSETASVADANLIYGSASGLRYLTEIFGRTPESNIFNVFDLY